MFLYNSSSNEISSNANDLVQNFKNNGVEQQCAAGQPAEPANSTCSSNESKSAVQDRPTQPSYTFPTNHMPDMRDNTERIKNWPGEVGSQASSMSSTSPTASSMTSEAAQSTNVESTIENGLYSKDDLPSAATTHSTSQVATRSRSAVKPLHTGCDTCGCYHLPDENCASCSKSEACSFASSQADCSTTLPSSEGNHELASSAIAHISVISSSSGKVATEMELFPPSPCTDDGAQQGSTAVSASARGSSSSVNLHTSAQNHTNGGAIESTKISHENTSDERQNRNSSAAILKENQRQSPGSSLPAWNEELTLGALNFQDNNSNVKVNPSNISVKEHSLKGGEDAKHSGNAWSQTPLNIPEAEIDKASLEPLAIQATVQGINDGSNPPTSFNYSVNISDKKPVSALTSNAEAVKNDYATSNEQSEDKQGFTLVAKNLNTNQYDMTRRKSVLTAFETNRCIPDARYKVVTGMNILDGPASNARWGIPCGVGLRGGGGSSLNNGTSGWGTPPSANNNSNNTSNNGNNPGATSAAAAGWGTASTNVTNNPGNNQSGQAQWGSANNNRPSSGNNSSAPAPQNPGGNGGPPNKGNNPMAGQSQPPNSTQVQQPGQPTPGQQGQPNPSGQQGPQPSPQQGQPPQNPASQQPPTSQQPPHNGSNSWAQAAGDMSSGQPPQSACPPGNNNGGPPGSNGGQSGLAPSGGSSTSSTTSSKQQLEQLNTMREALFSPDGWGGNVNQDSGWDIPSSPEPVLKDNNLREREPWEPNVNGTDLWEVNVRNGGQPPPTPPQTQPKLPWGHTPTTNIGGTWGEDEEVDREKPLWGVPRIPSPLSSPSSWGSCVPPGPGPAGPGAGPPNSMWSGPKKDEWNRNNSNWGEARGGDPRMGMDAMGGDPRDMRGGGAGMDPRDMRGGGNEMIRGGDMRGEPPRGPMDSMPMRGDQGMRDPRDIRGMGDMRSGDPMMRGISGRLNGGVGGDPGMWNQPPQPPHPSHHNIPHHQQSQPPRMGPDVGSAAGGNFPGGVNQWPGPPPKDMGLPGPGNKPSSGWEESSPPAQRRNIPNNYDDGTSLWGQQQGRMGGGNKVSHWKEMPTQNVNRGMQCPPGMIQNRMPGNNGGNMKQEGGQLWSHPGGRNGSWEGPHDGPTGGPWNEEPKGGMAGMNNWTEPPLTPSSWSGSKPKNLMNPGWVEGDVDSAWGQMPKSGPKPLTKEMLWGSKQFRLLTEMGYKKEDVENALRVSNMNVENALEMLNAGRMNVDGWRGSGHDEHGFDVPGGNHPSGGSGFSARGFPHNPPPMHFAPPSTPGLSNQPNVINMNSGNHSMTNINPALVQKLEQPPPTMRPPQQVPTFNQSLRSSQNQGNPAQLQGVVKQIQWAIGQGYMSHQVLNTPLSQSTLLLLSQLLNQVKTLQNANSLLAACMQQKGPNHTHTLQASVAVTKAKQSIANLQNQIQAAQAIMLKQQNMPSQGAPQDYFKLSNVHDSMTPIPNFVELSINKDNQVVNEQFQSQQSRLNQWKLPSLDKDPDEFSRAPGTTSKTPGLAQSHSSPNMNPILTQGDGPWASVTRSNSDTGWPDSGNVADGGQPDKDWSLTAPTNSAAFTDLVPEFEPGKPWKGNQLKSIEDDPSITPGSVVRSPLSLATIKDPEIFASGGSKTSPTPSGVDMALTPLSLSSSTWSYNTTASTASSFTSPLGKLGATKGPWGDGPVPTAVTSELWGAPMNKSRGPPPGLSNKNPSGNPGNGVVNPGGGGQAGAPGTGGGNSSSNGWGRGSGTSSWGAGATPGAGTSGSAGWGSTWLLLKNLTPQIDGSTLKTLCLQHGPLQNFHLYLNHGIALAKYQSREEANKAQAALTNCVLSNTTIFAESPSDSEVHNLLSHLGGHNSAQQQQQQQQTQQGGGAAPNWGLRSSGSGANAGAPSASGKAPPASQDTWGSGNSGSNQLWANTPTSSALWGGSAMDSTGDQHRATPSSFLPGDLLGGESM